MYNTTQLEEALEYLTTQGVLRWREEMDGVRADVFLLVDEDGDGNPVVSVNSSENADGEVKGISYPVTSKIYSLIAPRMRLKDARRAPTASSL
jgi:hypothetical protein